MAIKAVVSMEGEKFVFGPAGTELRMRNQERRIPDQTGCSKSGADPRCDDKTLEILSLVNSLFNLNKSQKDLPSTAAVQVSIER